MNCKQKSERRLVTVMSPRMFCLLLVLAYTHTSFAVPVPNSGWETVPNSGWDDGSIYKNADDDVNLDLKNIINNSTLDLLKSVSSKHDFNFNFDTPTEPSINFDGMNPVDSIPKFDFSDIPTQPSFNWDDYKFPEFKYEEPISTTPRYTYSHRIIFVPVGAIIFLISLCLRMCLCSSKKPTTVPVTIVRRTVITPTEANFASQETPDQPPSYTDVQKEDLPPPYSEVTTNTSPHLNPEVPQAATEPAVSPVAEGTDAASASASDLPSGDLTTSSSSSIGRPKFLVSQYSYKPLK